MRNPAYPVEIYGTPYNMQDLELNDSRASCLLRAFESCRTLAEWNQLSQCAFWMLAAFWNGNQVSYVNWSGLINDAVEEAIERIA